MPWHPAEGKGLYPSKTCPWLPMLRRKLNPVRLPIPQLRAGANAAPVRWLLMDEAQVVGDGAILAVAAARLG